MQYQFKTDPPSQKRGKLFKIVMVTLGLAALVVAVSFFAPKPPEPSENKLMTNTELVEKLKFFARQKTPTLRFSARQKKLATFGKQIFFDPRFSSNQQVSCASCHRPDHAFAEPKAVSTGIRQINRNAPSLLNLAENTWFFWDGRASSLAEQSLGPLFHADEMGLSPSTLIKVINSHYRDEYNALFKDLPDRLDSLLSETLVEQTHAPEMSTEMAAYGLATLATFSSLNKILKTASDIHRAPASLFALAAAQRKINFDTAVGAFETEESLARKVDRKSAPASSNRTPQNFDGDPLLADSVILNVGLALEAYQKGLIANDSSFDRFVKRVTASGGIEPSLTEDFNTKELEGLKLFMGDANCHLCHNGPNFSDQGFHNIGLGENKRVDALEIPVGRAQGVLDALASPYACNSEVMKKVRAKARAEEPHVGCEVLEYLSTENLELMGAFKTPSLRNANESAPYMHDGRFESLEDVLEHYNNPESRPAVGHREETIKPLALSQRRKGSLIQFLKSLSSPVVDLSSSE